MENDKKVIITGGSGFIGQHLARKFLDKGHHVKIFDINEPTEEDLIPHFIKGDIFDIESLEKSLAGYDVVIHLVGLADAGVAQKDPRKSFQLNIVSLRNVLEVIRGSDVKLIFPSSAAVYGITEELPIKETFPPKPTNIYSWHKYLCEELLKGYHANYQVDYVILRFFNVYGRGNKGVIDIFLEKAKKGEVIESYGAHQYRDFVYAGDLTEALYNATLYDKINNRTVNIGSGKGIQILEILDMVCEMFPQAKWVSKKAQFTMYDSIADITLASILIDFKPHDTKEFMKEIIKKEMV